MRIIPFADGQFNGCHTKVSRLNQRRVARPDSQIQFPYTRSASTATRASALYGYGFALGPAIGGLLLQTVGAGVWYFSAVAFLLYLGAVRLLPARKDWVTSLEKDAGLEAPAT